MKKASGILVIALLCALLCACIGNNVSNDDHSDSAKKLKNESLTETTTTIVHGDSTMEHNEITNEKDSETQENESEQDLPQKIESEKETVQETIETVKEVFYYVSHTFVNFRKEPTTNGELIEKLPNGTKVTKLEEMGEWFFVQYGTTKGYVHRDYLSEFPPPSAIDGASRVVVKKSKRLLELWKGETLIQSFPVGLGWDPKGHKQTEGDGKTPEGEYYVCTRNRNSSYYLSLGLSYPNKEDALRALQSGLISNNTYNRIANAIDNGRAPDWNTALGGEIMIHGCGSSSDWTAGCVAVENDVMDLLFDYCPLGTKVTILP